MRISEIIKPAKTIDYPFVVHSMHLPSRWAQAEASSVRRALVRLFFLLSSSFHSILYFSDVLFRPSINVCSPALLLTTIAWLVYFVHHPV